MEKPTPVVALQHAVKRMLTQSALAAELSKRTGKPISQARVWNWLNRDGGAPAELCPDIEDMTGVPCEELRPDVNWAVVRGKALVAGEGAHA